MSAALLMPYQMLDAIIPLTLSALWKPPHG
jgi:hypothetical protein